MARKAWNKEGRNSNYLKKNLPASAIYLALGARNLNSLSSTTNDEIDRSSYDYISPFVPGIGNRRIEELDT